MIPHCVSVANSLLYSLTGGEGGTLRNGPGRGLYAFAAWRWIDYLVDSRYVSPTQWEAYQHTLLPEAMIGPASATVHALWHWMVR